MSETANIATEADTNQARASDPTASAWVSANAGTGKTEVLVKRCLRLFLAGARPESILCLTYTKTAAAAMQNRLLKELAAWATVPTDALREKLQALMGRSPDEVTLRAARRLFALALEARGGLKIYTIHGFCERILQRFPLEADVTPHFKVLDELAQGELRRDAFDRVMARAAKDPDGLLGKALAKITAITSEDYFRSVVDALLKKRAELERMVIHHGGGSEWPEAECRALRTLLGVGDAEEEALVQDLAELVTDLELDAALAAFASFAGAAKTDKETEALLRAARAATGDRRVAALREAFLTDKGEPKKTFYCKGFADAEPIISGALRVAQLKFAGLALKLAHLRVAEASAALLALADAIHGEYERAKRADAVLDYDDLILKTSNLLLEVGAGAWVLFKIDGGVDHILVDEAQDTNPAQWSIIERLAEEFFAGVGASGKLRTLFAVGDEKQSIYSFQGADPVRFGAVGRDFRVRVRAAELIWNEVPLNLSFRSTEPVLEAVDQVFAKAPAARGLTSDAATVITHSAHRKGQAGLVELWELETEAKLEPAAPFEPWNEAGTGARAVDALCARIAALIKHWLASREELEFKGRPVGAGDILILVRRRDPFTTPMVRALKRAGVPVAGADRMQLLEQLVVQDLVALADVLLMPEDDLALAVVLKSPLFGLDDAALFDLAYDRKISLWETLKAKSKDDNRFAEAAERLAAWLGRTDFAPPYEFFLELLGENGQAMRRRLLNRLGPEAAEALDEFLDLALTYDREAAPSLQGFIDRLRESDIEIKRDMEQERDEVRIMTVHGAKGLQAPIVFLPDTCMTPRPQGPRILPLPRVGLAPGTVSHLVWPPTGHSDLEALADAKAELRQAEHEEHHRLLYVAMTRACDRLYVCGWQGLRKARRGLLVRPRRQWTERHPHRSHGRRRQKGVAAQKRIEGRGQSRSGEDRGDQVGKPTGLGGAPPRRSASRRNCCRRASDCRPVAADGGAAERHPCGRRRPCRHQTRGRIMHTLLQYAADGRQRGGRPGGAQFRSAPGADLLPPMRGGDRTRVLAVRRRSEFRAAVRPGSPAEVPLVARLGDGKDAVDPLRPDRSARGVDDGLLVLDYKTNRPPPSEPDQVARGYISQLAAYRLALRGMFPDLPLRAAIIWTDGPKLMEIPSTLLDAAERRILSGERQP